MVQNQKNLPSNIDLVADLTNKSSEEGEKIHIIKAKENNLKDISLSIPHKKLVVITGLSGSGKSSLAFDVIYSEGQRRYIESMSAYVRQFLHAGKKADVEKITGLWPAIAIDQKTISKNPRSTVGTMTEILDYLRLLFARIGKPYSPVTNLLIKSQPVSEVVDLIFDHYSDQSVYILSPIAREEKGEFKREFFELKKKGFSKILVDGFLYLLGDEINLEKNKKHNIEVLIDKLTINQSNKNRLTASIELGFKEGGGICFAAPVIDLSKPILEKITFSQKYACPVSGFQIPEIEPKMLSFNTPIGACLQCCGLGIEHYFDEHKIVPNESLSIRQGALKPWAQSLNDLQHCVKILEELANEYKFSLSCSFKDLPKKARDIIFHGTNYGENVFDLVGKPRKKIQFSGLIATLESKCDSMKEVKDLMSEYKSIRNCINCHGYRIKPEMLCVKIDHKHIGEVQEMNIVDHFQWVKALKSKLSDHDMIIANRILDEIGIRLSFLIEVGLGYLTLFRKAGTLSGGESQRIRLASQIGSGLSGVIYVLDEPSIGLHPRDTAKLISILKKLVQQNNSVIVVEHDTDIINSADHIIDIGPMAGIHGGTICAQGTIEDIKNSTESLTGQYLSYKKHIQIPYKARAGNGLFIELKGANENNLKNINLRLPLGKFIAVTGVSGSGKSTLIMQTLYRIINKHFSKDFKENSKDKPGKYDRIDGLENIDKIIEIDQNPIGRTPRSNIATYNGIFSYIREVYANLPISQVRGYSMDKFSFNVKGGRCEVCQGAGLIKQEMYFMNEIFVKCDTCNGFRYNKEILEVKYKDKSINDVLNLTIDNAVEFFENIFFIYDKLKKLQEVGLGYLTIGQSATTLSGGEAQRVKLSKELSIKSTGKTLYILDEPTTGLHMYDIEKLLSVLHKLVDQGNTVLVIEHNLDVIKTSDYIVDIGPDGGTNGGQIIAEGTINEIIDNANSITGVFLKKMLQEEISAKP